MSDRQCSLCSQIQGQPANDLIAAMLPDQPYARRVMLETAALAVIPSLGPLAPGHSLLCPKGHSESFAQLSPDLDEEFQRITAVIRHRLAEIYQAPVHLFEHGMAAGGIRTLCTTTHAHLHFIPLPSPFEAPEVGGARWVGFDGSLTALRDLAGDGEYILYEKPAGHTRILRSPAGQLESQYMRKLLARRLGRPDDWDWKATPNAELADRTWRRFVSADIEAPVLTSGTVR